jgi:hypothetical protein
VTALAAVMLVAIAIFGASAARLAFQDVEQLEVEEASLEAAGAAAIRAGALIVGGASDFDVTAAMRDEANAVSAANITRGTWQAANATRTSSSDVLILVEVTVTVHYEGLAGALDLSATRRAQVRRPPGP